MPFKYSLASYVTAALLILAGGAVLYAQSEAAPGARLGKDASNARICTRIIRCDAGARDAANFRMDCADFLQRSRRRFPVQFAPLSHCARQTACDRLNFSGCLLAFYTAIKLDRAATIPQPIMPPREGIPLRELSEWPAPIAAPDGPELKRMASICESGQQCAKTGNAIDLAQNEPARLQSRKYCVEWLTALHRAQPEQYPVVTTCMQEHPCAARKQYECSVRRNEALREAEKQTPAYKAAMREISPHCDRVRECRLKSAAPGESIDAETDGICRKFLFSFRKFPGRFRHMTACIQNSQCEDGLFSTCLSDTIQNYRK